MFVMSASTMSESMMSLLKDPCRHRAREAVGAESTNL